MPGQADRFLVMSRNGERALIEWNRAADSYRYSLQTGDPLNYRPVIEALTRKHQLRPDGFATAEAWMAETLTHRYPLALERITRGHTQATLNPASILISLDNGYVHAGWLIKKGSEMVTFGGTHGALDDLNSNGILLSSYAPTADTSSSRVAALFEGFPGRREYRAEGSGAEWVSHKTQALRTSERASLDGDGQESANGGVGLRVWTPSFAQLGAVASVEVTVEKAQRYLPPQIRRADPLPKGAFKQHFTLKNPMTFPGLGPYERVYALPPDRLLEAQRMYHLSGWIRGLKSSLPIFRLTFHTDRRGLPVAH